MDVHPTPAPEQAVFVVELPEALRDPARLAAHLRWLTIKYRLGRAKHRAPDILDQNPAEVADVPVFVTAITDAGRE